MAEEQELSEKELNAVLDRLIQGKTPEDILGQTGLVKDLTRRLVERVLEGEMTAHLGYEKHAQEGRDGGNSRNGKTGKRVKTDTSEIDLEVPRDRDGTFEPVMVAKGQRRLPGFDEKVIALYARGMTTREIQGHLKELYQVEVSPTLISAVTDAVLEDVRAWQARPLDAVYPIVYLDAIHVKMRTAGHVESQAVYLALAINLQGQKELLGLWVGEAEGAKFWLSVLTELKNRGVQDILIAAVDGLKGFPDAIEAVYPEDPGAAVYRAPHPRLAALRVLEGTQGRGPGPEGDLPGADARGGRRGPGGVCRALGRTIPADQPDVADALDQPDAVLRLSAGDPEGYLHDERGGVGQCPAAQGDEAPGRVPDPRLREEGVVLGHHESQRAVEPARPGLDLRPEPSVHRFRGTDTRLMSRPFTQKS